MNFAKFFTFFNHVEHLRMTISKISITTKKRPHSLETHPECYRTWNKPTNVLGRSSWQLENGRCPL